MSEQEDAISSEAQMLAEAELAERLLAASDADRRTMYGDVYDQIYAMHLRRAPDILEFGASEALVPFLEQMTKIGHHVLEVGCGTGLLSVELARRGRIVTGIDVSAVALEKARDRGAEVTGVSFKQVSGFEIGEPETFDFAFSVEVLEHLHERDVPAHLAGVNRVLKLGGSYWILTPRAYASGGAPDRFGVDRTAPADVHLKEWTYTELGAALRRAGFRDLQPVYPGTSERRAHFAKWPWALAFERTPPMVQRHRLVRSLLGRAGYNIASCSLLARRPNR